MGLSGNINRTLRTLRAPGPARHKRLVLASLWTDAVKDVPSIACPALDWLNALDLSSSFVVEFGSGASTAYFAHRAKRLLSIEHHPGWHAEVARRLEQWRARGERLGSVEALLIKPDQQAPAGSENNAEFETPDNIYISNDAKHRGQSFRGYASAVDQLPDSSVDLAFIDGRARLACAAHVEPKLRPGGSAVLDNAERPRYQPITDLFTSRGYTITEHRGLGLRSGKVWSTTVFIKPA